MHIRFLNNHQGNVIKHTNIISVHVSTVNDVWRDEKLCLCLLNIPCFTAVVHHLSHSMFSAETGDQTCWALV